MPLFLALGVVIAVVGYVMLGNNKPIVTQVLQGKRYMFNMTLPPDKISLGAAQIAALMSGEWGNIQFLYYPGTGGKLPTGKFAQAIAALGWSPSTGVIAQATRTGPTVVLTPDVRAQEV